MRWSDLTRQIVPSIVSCGSLIMPSVFSQIHMNFIVSKTLWYWLWIINIYSSELKAGHIFCFWNCHHKEGSCHDANFCLTVITTGWQPVVPPVTAKLASLGFTLMQKYHQTTYIRRTKYQHLNSLRLVLKLSLSNPLKPCVYVTEWRCSWSSADRRCSNYIWVSKNIDDISNNSNASHMFPGPHIENV